MSETLEQAIEAWRRSMWAAGSREETLRVRTQLIVRLAADGDPRAMTREQVEDFLTSNRAWKPNTLVGYYRTLRSWFTWLTDTDRIERSPMHRMRQPRSPRGVPHPVDTALLQRAIETTTGDMRAWLILGAYAGLRRTEIASFRGDMIRGDSIRVVGKGGVVGEVPLHPRIAELAEVYPAKGYWFPARPEAGGRQTSRRPYRSPDCVSQDITELFKRLGGTGTTHALRHWFGTQALEAAGGNLRTVQTLMRHSSVAITERYTLVRDANRTAAVLALPDVVGGAR